MKTVSNFPKISHYVLKTFLFTLKLPYHHQNWNTICPLAWIGVLTHPNPQLPPTQLFCLFLSFIFYRICVKLISHTSNLQLYFLPNALIYSHGLDIGCVVHYFSPEHRLRYATICGVSLPLHLSLNTLSWIQVLQLTISHFNEWQYHPSGSTKRLPYSNPVTKSPHVQLLIHLKFSPFLAQQFSPHLGSSAHCLSL